MDLKTYEHVKFELAQLIRSGQFAAAEPEKDSNKRYDVEQSINATPIDVSCAPTVDLPSSGTNPPTPQ